MASVPIVASPYPDRVRLPFAFDPARLAGDLAEFEASDWTAHFVRQNYEGDWSALPLRAHASARHPIHMIYSPPGATEFVDTPLLARTPYFREVLAAFACPITCVRLMRLTPGSRIHEHNDNDLAAEQGWARIHVPVTTNPDVSFHLNGTAVAMVSGRGLGTSVSPTRIAPPMQAEATASIW